jgi:hypothetical protein
MESVLTRRERLKRSHLEMSRVTLHRKLKQLGREEGRVQLSISGKGGAGQLSNGLRTRFARRESFSK